MNDEPDILRRAVESTVCLWRGDTGGERNIVQRNLPNWTVVVHDVPAALALTASPR
jgi:hypothetical protein